MYRGAQTRLYGVELEGLILIRTGMPRNLIRLISKFRMPVSNSEIDEGEPAMSHAVLAELIGISKRSVQCAVMHVMEGSLIKRRIARPTAVPVYTVLTPWIRHL